MHPESKSSQVKWQLGENKIVYVVGRHIKLTMRVLTKREREGFAATISFGAKKVQDSLCRQLCTCICQMFTLKGNDPVLKLEVQ